MEAFWTLLTSFDASQIEELHKVPFVRDPFVRLISAFRDKFVKPDEYFYSRYGSTMLHRYANISKPTDSAQEAFAAGIRLSFTHFIKYLLDPQTEEEKPFNEHWQQMYRLCHPCQIEYDFVGKLETLDEDTEHLLKILGLDNYIHFPPGYENRTAVDWEREWFANISVADRRKLYHLYEQTLNYLNMTNLRHFWMSDYILLSKKQFLMFFCFGLHQGHVQIYCRCVCVCVFLLFIQ